MHHENIHELGSLRFLNLNLEWQNIKMGRKTYEDLSFFFHETVLNHHHVIGYHSCFYSCSLPLMASAIIIATHGQNILQ